ncbi:O-antigen ligase [Balneicella halophila]|uniref:O-antigen ligase n=1 Tax=Balneicella halophila TaxID=1537566 RepID=A0A7L4UPI5_BALHA|nr:O-antigen ligase family protein [Balneicella halophila]PVX50797.1 O-antigen ligase [Balneicella halophila]
MNKKGKAVTQSANPNLLSSFLLLAYGFVTWLTPNMDTFDSNGPKFLTFSILNLLVFAILIWYVRKKNGFNYLFRFFDTKVGLAYGILMLFTLLSFVKAININESILHFSKVFTTFAGAWFIGILVSKDKKSLVPVAVGLSILLILDSFQTFNGISKFINGELKSIGLIKASYSNRNILVSAMFVKLPFALWLFYFQKSWLKYLGGLSLFLGILATLLMGARAFYLGLIALTILLLIYAFLKSKKVKNRKPLKQFLLYVLILAFSFGIYSFVESKMYPNRGTAFVNRIESITSTTNNSNKLRLTSWETTATQMIPKDPFLGVGVGNWKLRYLEYENSWSPTYTYMYKNHNDFLEITAESGIFAGIAFVCIFIFIFWYFAVALIKRPESEEEKYFFLPAFGIVAYFFDAFFNFPQDRPEIQSWFALYVGMAAGIALLFYNEDSPLFKYKFKGRRILNLFLAIITAFLLVSSVYILTLNKKSLVYQRDIKEDINTGKLKRTYNDFKDVFPSIPDITILAEPIAIQKARYLLNEKKYDEARRILYHDNSNPFDARKEYFIAMTFYNEKQFDSAIYYAKKALDLKPFFYNTNTILASSYEKKGQPDKSIEVWRNFLKGVKNKEQAWTVPVSLLRKKGNLKEAEMLIDSAYHYLPNNKNILSLRNKIKQQTVATPYLSLYKEASKFFVSGQYKKALPLFNEFIDKVPESAEAYGFRAICYFKLGNFKKAIEDINTEEKLLGNLPPSMINIRGASYLNVGNKEMAKADFKKAMDMGDKDGKTNYNKFFKEEKKKISFQIPVKK